MFNKLNYIFGYKYYSKINNINYYIISCNNNIKFINKLPLNNIKLQICSNPIYKYIQIIGNVKCELYLQH